MSYVPYGDELYERDRVAVRQTAIPGLRVVELAVVKDGRGWSKDIFDRDRREEFGLDQFVPVRWCANASRTAGVTRGIHAELANKYVTLSRGRILAAIVDFRDGADFGRVELIELTPARALFIPVGCGNSYQTLTDDVHYSYLTDRNVDPSREVTRVNVADPDLAIPWPIPLDAAVVLEEDRGLPWLSEIVPLSIDQLAARDRADPNGHEQGHED